MSLSRFFAVTSVVCASFFVCFSLRAEENRPAWRFAEGDFAPLFPFKVEKGAPENVTNVQTWGAKWPDAGAGEILSVRNGHFYKGDELFRFMGTNICFSASFCNHEAAERLAETFARFGIRVVRLHHMDSHDIWGKNFEKTKTEIDPERLERLDYLIAQFEKRGIYVNINLHVSRGFDERDGFENSKSLHNQCKGIDNFEPRMIALQKKYARDLLTHVNPYTGRAYTDDPGVAMIEINNENSVVACWFWGVMDSIGEPYSVLFRDRWNEWLLKKYGTTGALKKAWGDQDEPLGEDQIASKAFPAALTEGKSADGWEVQRDAVSRQSVSVMTAKDAGLPNPASDETNVLKITIENNGSASWIPQLYRTGLRLDQGALYTWSFKIRTNRPAKITAGVRQNHEPWQGAGIDVSIAASSEWQSFSHSFYAPETDENVRIAFASFLPGLTIELADISLQKGGKIGLGDHETLEEKTVPILRRDGAGLFPGKAHKLDFLAFLLDLETVYWNEMADFVENELGAKPPVTGTQLQYGSSYAQAVRDYCDNHSYWHHPVFPNRAWDGNDWFINNAALVNERSGGTVSSLAANRVLGKAQTISEYDHAYPNLYGAEGNLMLAAVGAFQGWTGINHFAWSHGTNFDPSEQTTFFDMCGNSAKIVHLPACRAMLERRDIQSGPGHFAYTQKISKSKELEMTAERAFEWNPINNVLASDRTLALACWAGIELTDDGLDVPPPAGVTNVADWNGLPADWGRPESGKFTNEFGELRWNTQIEGAGFFTVDTPGVKVFTGFVRDRTFALDGITLTPGKTRLDWTTVSITAASGQTPKAAQKDGKPILAPGRYLIAATGLVQNTDARFVEYEPGKITMASAYGGSRGEAPALCEGIPLDLTLSGYDADKVTLWALDSAGNRAASVPVESAESGSFVRLGPQYKTLWYEMELK